MANELREKRFAFPCSLSREQNPFHFSRFNLSAQQQCFDGADGYWQYIRSGRCRITGPAMQTTLCDAENIALLLT